jgi:hypothetical protein
MVSGGDLPMISIGGDAWQTPTQQDLPSTAQKR